MAFFLHGGLAGECSLGRKLHSGQSGLAVLVRLSGLGPVKSFGGGLGFCLLGAQRFGARMQDVVEMLGLRSSRIECSKDGFLFAWWVGWRMQFGAQA